MTHPGNGHTVFTPARLVALQAHWEAGLDAEEIKQRLNALPGPPVRNRKFIWHKASAIGLKRPEGWLLKRKRRPRHNLWTADRLELLRNLINLLPDADVLERVNALPGPELKNIKSMRRRAQRMGYLAAKPLKSGPEHTTWTDERLALLRQCYGRLPSAELLAALNAMPGAQIASINSARKAAFAAGIKSAGLVRTPPPPRARRALRPAKPRPTFAPSAPEPEPAPLTPEEQEARVAEMLSARETTAFKMFAARKDAHAVSATLKIPLWQACRLQGAYRQQNQEAA